MLPSPYADPYRYHLLHPDEPPLDAAWVALSNAHPGPVLEHGAGTGRLTAALAHAGLQVTAVDNDPGMLALLHRRRLPGVQTVLADMTAPQDAVHSTVLAPMRLIQHLRGVPALVQFFKAAYASSLSHAQLAFDVYLPGEALLDYDGAYIDFSLTDANSATVHHIRQHTKVSDTHLHTITVWDGGEPTCATLELWPRAVLLKAAETAGWSLSQEAASVHGEAASEGSCTWFAVLAKS